MKKQNSKPEIKNKKEANKPKLTKRDLIKIHLRQKQHISSSEAIELYGVTRLASDIFYIKKRLGWTISSQDITKQDRFGNDCTFSKYILVSTNEKKSID